jgi:hypothetical protein
MFVDLLSLKTQPPEKVSKASGASASGSSGALGAFEVFSNLGISLYPLSHLQVALEVILEVEAV